MGDTSTSNGNGTKSGKVNGARAPESVSATSAEGSRPAPEPVQENVIEYYILCPQRPTELPGLITHLISRDICEKRQAEAYHKCPNCVRSRIWRERNGLPVDEKPVEQHAG